MLVTLTSAGHAAGAAAFGPPIAMAVADWLHLGSTSVWLGGLGVLTVALVRSRPALTDAERRAWVARFTKLAVPAVVLMLLTGTYAALAHEPHPLLLLTTLWGDALAVKIVLVAILLILGGQSLLAARGQLRVSGRVLCAEVGLAIVVLLATGVLVGQALPACMVMPPGSVMPKDAKMPPGMQMCFHPRTRPRGVGSDVT